MSPCQHPGKTQQVRAQKSHVDVKVDPAQARDGLCRSRRSLGARREGAFGARRVRIRKRPRKQRNVLHRSYDEAIMSATVFSCRLTLAQSSSASSAHLENLIIYTSAPLDAVPI